MKVEKVLLVEDSVDLQKLITEMIMQVFGESTEVVVAGSLIAAQSVYENGVEEFDIIFLDTHLKGDNGYNSTTYLLASLISEKFNLPMMEIKPLVAISSEEDAREEMKKCGCTHECEKQQILSFLTNWKECCTA